MGNFRPEDGLMAHLPEGSGPVLAPFLTKLEEEQHPRNDIGMENKRW
jgi:hypothetical protein